MSHIHLPDGIISPIWWVTGYLLCFTILFFILRKLDGEEIRRKVPMIGIVSAIMLLGMSVPLGIVPVHLSLAVLSGILLGPGFGFIAAFVVNLLLALIAHGGVTLIGLNTLIVGTEIFVGYHLFKAFSKKFSQMPSTVFATSIALVVSMALTVTIVGATAGLVEVIPHHHDHGHVEEEILIEEGIEETVVEESIVSDVKYMVFSGWTALFLILLVGNALESFGTAYIVRFFMKIRPDLIHQVKQ